MKKIMILTAERTGNGHKSAANAIENKLKKYGYETKQVDCFEMMNKKGILIENSYMPLTRRAPFIHYFSYLFSQVFPNIVHIGAYTLSKRKFVKEILDYKPDLIISVHCVFTKAISYLLKKEKLNIPFYVNVIDLVNPPKIWMDKNADMLFVPTEDVKKIYIQSGIDKEKIIVSGFPIREDIIRRTSPKKITDKVNILLVNPSIHLRKNIKYVKEISRLNNISLTVICGKDQRLYERLIKEQKHGNISKNIHIYSFVKNMNEYLSNAHILLAKAGPNMILEGARSGTAIVITGHIQGQENKNYEYVIKNNCGFKCENPNIIYEKLNNLISSNEINNYLKNVLNADCTNGTEIITTHIHNAMKQ